MLDWQTAFKQIMMHRTQWSLFSFEFLDKLYIPSVVQFDWNQAPKTFSKFSKSAALYLIKTQHLLFSAKISPFKGFTFQFPRFQTKHDSWLDNNGANLTTFLQNKAIDRMKVLMDDVCWGNITANLCQLMDTQVLQFNTKANIKTKTTNQQ